MLADLFSGDIKVTQSNAILRYIARKNDLLGKTEAEMVRVDIMAEQSMDFRNGLVKLCYNPMFVSRNNLYLHKNIECLSANINCPGLVSENAVVSSLCGVSIPPYPLLPMRAVSADPRNYEPQTDSTPPESHA